MPFFDVILSETNVYHVRVQAVDESEALDWAHAAGWEYIQQAHIEPSFSESAGISCEEIETDDMSSVEVSLGDKD